MSSNPLDLNDPTAVLLAVAEALRRAGVETATYGGLALAAYGDARETRDADLAVHGLGGERAAAALRTAGLEVLVAFDRMPFGGNVVTRVTLLGGAGHTGLNVADFVEPRSRRYAGLVLERALEGRVRGTTIKIVSPEDFVLLKALSTRERDLEDAANVVRRLGDRLDLTAVGEEAARLAQEIPDHDVLGRVRRIREQAVAE